MDVSFNHKFLNSTIYLIKVKNIEISGTKKMATYYTMCKAVRLQYRQGRASTTRSVGTFRLLIHPPLHSLYLASHTYSLLEDLYQYSSRLIDQYHSADCKVKKKVLPFPTLLFAPTSPPSFDITLCTIESPRPCPLILSF
jgi:hypothetical protein